MDCLSVSGLANKKLLFVLLLYASRCKIEGCGLVERTRTNNSRKQLPTTERSIPISLCVMPTSSMHGFLEIDLIPN